MRNEDKAPLLSNFLTLAEMIALAGLVDRITAGYREFYRLPFLLGADTVSPEEHETFVQLTPPQRIAFLADMHGQLLVEIDKQGGTP